MTALSQVSSKVGQFATILIMVVFPGDIARNTLIGTINI